MMLLLMMLASCAIFKKKCDCPKVGKVNSEQKLANTY